MEYPEILENLAPCGLDCARCFSNEAGEVRKLSGALLEALRNFETFAERKAESVPVYRNYPAFAEMLQFFSTVSCGGCRHGEPANPLCAAKTCHREKAVDFCFQCGEFPCGRNRYNEHLALRWRAMGERMREIGVEAFYEERKGKPRY